MNFLELTNLHKSYDAAPLLCGVSFTVERGEIACLLGPSGSGKTTLLRILAGLEEIEAGRVTLDGQDLTHVPTHRRGVVLMFQDYALFPHKSVAENVAFGLRMQAPNVKRQMSNAHDVSRLTFDGPISARVAEMLALVGLDGFGPRDVNSLSGGERQRVALARSLAPNPRLLLLDEPLGALDRALRERLLEELPAILRRVGVTAITVTHDQEEALALADRVILLHEGRVVQAGRPEAVYAAPANAWAARFLGLENLIPATARRPAEIETAMGVFTLPDEATRATPNTRGELLVHAWGIRPDANGNIQALITKRAFHGARYRVTAMAQGTIALHFWIDAGQAVGQVGEEITLAIDPAALQWCKA